ncbi:hypothetical protein EV702DRAFT_1281573 [Suillus placidus]|uniref:Methyltransferase domain-containing protein n=1 Tax=Suillus placidus TaxID=48579 RepID=A0A9P7CYP7_9AGAM|nr:hypothetical protein EV702DRAFT_1281573 [Suillus placidus]
MAFMAIMECSEMDDVAGKAVSAVVGATLDKEKLVRDQAFQAVGLFLHYLYTLVSQLEAASTEDGGEDVPARLPGAYTQAGLVKSAMGAAAVLTGWAVSSLGTMEGRSLLLMRLRMRMCKEIGERHVQDNSTPSDPALALNVHGGIDTSSRLHHRFRRQQVPYPRSYQRKVVDLDAIDTLLTRQMSGGSLTWHAFPQSWNEQPAQEPLKRILDVGCGDGVWVIEAAKYWKGCQVVGLDIVSLHPDLAHLSRDKDLPKRMSWVQANLYVHPPSPYPALISRSLEGLPFPNESFNFVHVKRIARGVPENMWDDLFEEISRVMKPGPAFEVVEEDLSFPGRSDGEGSEVGTLRSNISMSTYSLSPGTESGRRSAVKSMSSLSDFIRAVTTPDSVPSIIINARSYRSIADDSPISILDPPSTATTPSPSSPSHPLHSSSSSQSTFLSFSSYSSTPTPSMMNTTPRPPPSHEFNKAVQAVLMEPTLTPFFAGVGSITSSGSGSSSASLFTSSAASGVALSTSPSSGNGNGASSTSS